jgi:cytochrome c oxidase subunit 4
MSHNEMSVEEVRKHVRTYLAVFAVLLVLTCVTVGVFYLHLSLVKAITVALIVASIKGSLVACYFMHLISERAAIFWIIFLCALFFIVLLLVPAVTMHESSGVVL